MQLFKNINKRGPTPQTWILLLKNGNLESSLDHQWPPFNSLPIQFPFLNPHNNSQFSYSSHYVAMASAETSPLT